MRKGIVQGLFIIVLVYTLASCAPFGPIYDSSSSDQDDFWTVPRRIAYDEGSDFVRADDLWVFSSSQGAVQRVDIRQVAIGLVIDPDSDADDPQNRVSINAVTRLSRSLVGVGRKLVIVSWQGMSAHYSIEIQDLTDSGTDPSNRDNGDKTFGGFIKWE